MEKNFNDAFSGRLRFFMNLYGLNQKDIAQKIGVSEASVSNWIKGVKVPRADKIDKMCELFNCNRSDLVKESTNEVDSKVQEHITNYSHLHADWQALIDDLIKAAQEEPQDSEKIWAIVGKISAFLRS